MGILKKVVFVFFTGLAINCLIYAQDFGFGFGDDEGISTGAGTSKPLSVSISGDVSAAIVGYFDEMSEAAENNDAKYINTRDMFMFSGKLNFHAESSFAEGIVNLKLVPALVPVSIDEAYLCAFFGNFDFSAGLRKITWGKADQFGPLDVINMLDSTKIFIEMADNNNLNGVKLATPVIHCSFRFGQFSKIEGIVLPSFEIVSMAVSSVLDGSNEYLSLVTGPVSERWIPKQMNKFFDEDGNLKMPFIAAKTNTLDYAQAGLRFTTTIGSADIGLQYFYGRMFQPAVKFNLTKISLPTGGEAPYVTMEFLHNKYHQFGLDYAQVLAGFNIRAEVAGNITEDLDGDDGLVYNPSIGWSFGFDRDLFLGINLNLQANGSVRLLDDKIGNSNDPYTYISMGDFDIPIGYNPNYDIEADTSMTATRITGMLSKKFLRDELELRTAVVWGIEDEDCAIIPALIWTKDDLRVALSGGFFIGNKDGQLGQYKDNKFLKISVAYFF